MYADLLLTGARVYPTAAAAPAEAIAICGDRVLAVGSAAECEAVAGPGTRRVALGGRAIVPGLIDSHLHLLAFALRLEQVDLAGAASLDEAVARVSVGAASLPEGEWLLGGGWDANVWHRPPTRADLDAVAPRQPALLASKDCHSLWLNSEALRRAGIGAASENPAGGEIVRDAAGEPTGVLLENATHAAWSAVEPPSPERIESCLTPALRLAASKGLTGVQTFEGADVFGALQRLARRGPLDCRVCCHLAKGNLDDARHLGIETGFGNEWVRFGSLKLFLDGALGSQTAHMLEPYVGGASLGIPTLEPDEYRDLVAEAARAGLATAVHAIGDAANRVALDGLEATADVWRSAGLRPRIEHVQLLHPADVARLGRLGVIASMQPSHAPSDWMVADRYWGERSRFGYAWRGVLEAGAVLAFGSDCPVEPIDPLPGLHAAVTRQTPAGEPAGGWYPAERLSAREALHAFTWGAAYSSGEEHIKGTLGVGKLADLVVLSEDPLAGDPDAWLRARVEATLVGGRLAHGDLT